MSYEARRARRRHNPLAFAAWTLPLLFLAAAMWWMGGGMRILIPHALLAEIFLVQIALVQKPNAILQDVDVRVADGALWIGNKRVDLRDIRSANLLREPKAKIVRIERRRAPAIELVVPSTRDGRALLRALGFDASQSVARFRVASRLLSYPDLMIAAVLIVTPIIAIAGVIAHSAVLAVTAVAALLALLAWPSRVEVGPDGLVYRWLFWRTFLPAAEIASIEEASRKTRNEVTGVRLHTVDGTIVPMYFGRFPSAIRTGAALRERLREVRGGHETLDAPRELARGGMGAREWIAWLRSIGRVESYRASSIDEETLWRVVEAPNAATSDRAAAAIALAHDADARKRLRVAASAIVEPKLRVAIEAAASEDETELERALDDMHEL